ncbi:hypothetical protein [Ruminococcus albus]|uniref:Uncharacterized protein n=1 Tax=Ruminococcus albus TaxID=1264 RepID=A0A1I1JUH1_RUMAL|nr:hypothetical protein [Ruminococcus albus]SFC49453.1 hypothetical protein SAMN02910406_01803 [Ruminococcus albus]
MKANNTRENSKIKKRFPIAVISVAACAALVMGLTACSNNNDQTDLSAAAKDSSTNISVDNTNETNIVSETTESSVSNDVQNDPVGDSNIPSDNNDNNPEAANSQTENVEMSVDKMLSMDGEQLRALSNDDYEILEAASSQCANFGLKCAAFPEYVFVLECANYMYNKPEITIKVPYHGDEFGLGNKITQLNLYEGANVGNGVTVGMTYNEIEEQLGHDIGVSMVNTTLGLAAWTEIDGRYWALHFDVTDVPDGEIWKRLEESTEGGEINLDDPGHADLSDINPVCDLAVFDIEADNWHYGRI